jgi:hypothetical protein
MATRPPVIQHTTSGGSVPAMKIWGATSYLHQYFSASSLPVSTVVAPVAKTASVDQHTRTRYPGGPARTVRSHGRAFLQASGGGGGARPGNRFWCERSTGEGQSKVTTARQFAYEGSWANLKKWAKASRTGATFVLRNSSGRSEVIAPPATP